ncbi:MAG: hypothetical protein RL885_01950 [Planctomycetota bacterium]
MSFPWTNADALLRTRGRFGIHDERVPWSSLIVLTVLGGALYGFTMGSFSTVALLFGQETRDPPLRIFVAIFSATKVPLLLALSTSVCLPSFFVLNTLLGLRDDFSSAMRAILAAQGTLAIVLASLSPVTLFFYCCTERYSVASITNGVVFFLATLGAQVIMRRYYRPLIVKDGRHRLALTAWLMLYVFVAMQAAWMFRPFIGDPNLSVQFVRLDEWGICYVKIWEAISRFFTGR